MKQFDIIYLDPPWPYTTSKAIVGNAGQGSHNIENVSQVGIDYHYPSMSMDELRELPIKNIAAKNSLIFCWTTNAFMLEALELMKLYGFKQKTILTWVKTKKHEVVPSKGTGFWFRNCQEHLLFGVRGKVPRPEGFMEGTVFFHPRLEHSKKPDIFYPIMEAAFPGASCLELFARRKDREGWSYYGNEIISDIDINSYLLFPKA